jgi:8-oxo-dGTP diphosphatase
MRNDQVFWVGQKAFIRKGDEVLILNDPIEGLDFPGGKIQAGDVDLSASLKREVREETGLEIDVGEPFAVWQNIFPIQHKYAGKRIYLVGFRCTYVAGAVMLSNEHDSYKWVNRNTYRKLDHLNKYFQIVERYFE